MAEEKKPKKSTPKHGRWKFYQVSGNKVERKNKFCPKCGVGIFLAEHKERLSCGNCGYMEAKKK